MYLVIWEFEAAADRESDFVAAYGPQGDWAQLFRQGVGYVRTELNRDLHTPRTYVVFDYWQSESHYEQFKVDFALPYRELDLKCEALTSRETHIGTFEVL